MYFDYVRYPLKYETEYINVLQTNGFNLSPDTFISKILCAND